MKIWTKMTMLSMRLLSVAAQVPPFCAIFELAHFHTQVQAKKKKPAWPMLTTNLLETPRRSSYAAIISRTIQVKLTLHRRLWHAIM
jgi:hypothetical protein